MAFFFYSILGHLFMVLLTGRVHLLPTLALKPRFRPLLAKYIFMYRQVIRDSIHPHTSKKSYSVHTSISRFFVVQHFISMIVMFIAQFSIVIPLSILQIPHILSILLLITIWIVSSLKLLRIKFFWTLLNMLLVDICPHFSLRTYSGMSHTEYICFNFNKLAVF